jgi:hypothetical protein
MPSLSLADFLSGLAVVSARAFPDINTSTDETGAGQLNRATFGTRLWTGDLTIKRLRFADSDALAAKVQYLEEADVSFRFCPVHYLENAATTGTVDAIDSDRRVVTLNEARPDGDIFGITFATSKRSMHQVVSRSGFVHTVVPPLPFGVVPSDVTTYGRPEIDAVLTSANHPAFKRYKADGFRLYWKQTY